ncbi:alpha/beta hydrolase [Solicola gregarius]|uniref:Alpha/beta hydrolase n=1 Tax=Solicola gregarius TaxID=2908642 RepID=A0AA46TKV2_9ACTN|nr:alpha/beta hydrolase [Solicola gregarius]UYM07179.1 alpha/beta hydrolase [Solicola gregarius]
MRLAVVRTAAAVGAISLAASLLGAPADADRGPTAAEPAQVEAPVPDINWRACKGAAKYDCAQVRVPLDYDKPKGAKTRLRLTRDPANKPKRRIGTLFVNPGGPGGSAADFALDAGHLFGKAVRQRFDIVGVDPRGVGGSASVICKGKWHQPPKRPDLPFPLMRKAEGRWIKADNDLRAFCAKHGTDVMDNMSTADTARDMDLIRQALGDEKLTYYGVSYGTYLGSTYAALFPDRVRGLILDGVLDPVAWSTGRGKAGKKLPFSTRLRSGYGAYEAWASALDECARVGKTRCGASRDVGQMWRTVVRKARKGKLTIGGEKLRYEWLVSDVLGGLYSRSNYRYLMRYVQGLHRASTSKPGTRAYERAAADVKRLQERLRAIRRELPGPYAAVNAGARKRTYFDAFAGVSCSDSVNPKRPKAWVKASKRDDYAMPWFGRLWTWQSSVCARWPGSSADAFRGPWRVKTSAPVLLIGNSHDPATPISGARAANRVLDGSRLLMLDSWGHGAIGESRCVTATMGRYLVARKLPAAGTVCKPNRTLFPPRS